MPTLVRQRRPRAPVARRRPLPAILSNAAGGTSLVGSIDATSDWTSDLTFVPLAIDGTIAAVGTWSGAETYPAVTTSLTSPGIGGIATWVANAVGTFTSATILSHIDAAVASLGTVRAEKVAALASARGGPRAPLDLASSDLAYVDQVLRELAHARAQVVAYDVEV